MRRMFRVVCSLAVAAWDGIVSTVGRLVGRSPGGRCVILYYHSVPNGDRDRFGRQMEDLVRYARPVAVERIPAACSGDACVAVTFDDGFESVARNALPVLAALRIPSMLFIPSGCLGLRPAWLEGTDHPDAGERVLAPDDVRALAQGGLVSFGSHCRTHRNLRTLDDGTARREIEESKADLEAVVGSKVQSLSFPHGAYDDRHVEIALGAGYEFLYSISPTPCRPGERVAGRVRVDPGDSRLEFALKIRGAYRWMAAASAAKRKVREIFRFTLGAAAKAAI